MAGCTLDAKTRQIFTARGGMPREPDIAMVVFDDRLARGVLR